MDTICSENDRSMRYAQALARLVACPTISESDTAAAEARADAGACKTACAATAANPFDTFDAILHEQFPHIFAACEEEHFERALLLRWPGTDANRRPVLFMNHSDVVEPNGAWSGHGAFSGDIADGKVWGRGTLDTKGGLFGMLQAADELAAEGFVPSGDVYFESSHDEETGGSGALAVSDALAARGIRFRFSLDEGGYIVHDPLGGTDADFAMVGIGEKHLATLKFTAPDQGGHASTPGRDTGLVRLARFIAAADARAKRGRLFRVQLSPSTAAMLRRMAPSVTGPLSFVFAHPRAFRPLLKATMPAVSPTAASLMRTTIAFTMAKGSDAFNVLPTRACVYANMRCSHHEGLDGSIDAVKRLAARYKLEVEVVEYEGRAKLTDHDCEGFVLLEEALAAVYPGIVAAPYVMTGLSDSRFMDAVSDACLRFVPYKVSDTQVASIHGIDENVDVSTLAPGVDVYKHLMRAL